MRDGESADRRRGNDHRRHPCPHSRQRHALRRQCGRRDHQHRRVVVSSPRHIVASVSSLSPVLTIFTAAIALTCLRHLGSRCYCRQRRRCSPPLMVGCCVAYSVVCRPICHTPLSSSCDRQHFRRRPPSPIANLCQPLSYPSPSPLPSMVGCCIPCPPSSIPTEPPS